MPSKSFPSLLPMKRTLSVTAVIGLLLVVTYFGSQSLSSSKANLLPATPGQLTGGTNSTMSANPGVNPSTGVQASVASKTCFCRCGSKLLTTDSKEPYPLCRGSARDGLYCHDGGAAGALFTPDGSKNAKTDAECSEFSGKDCQGLTQGYSSDEGSYYDCKMWDWPSN
jgi:hypothetical protein